MATTQPEPYGSSKDMYYVRSNTARRARVWQRVSMETSQVALFLLKLIFLAGA